MAAAALVQNEVGDLLIVKPIYRDGWLLPGGMVELDESPKRACRREISEEVGLELPVGRLLCVDYETSDQRGTESLKFIFDGGAITQAQIAAIVLQEDELSAYMFVPLAEALNKLNAFSSRRTQQAFTAQKTGETVYLENQELS